MSTAAQPQHTGAPLESKHTEASEPKEKRAKHEPAVGEVVDDHELSESSLAEAHQAKAPPPAGAEKTLEKSAAMKRGTRPETTPLGAQAFQTKDEYFRVLAQQSALAFAVTRPSEEPIWVATRDDLVVDVFKGLIRRNISGVPVLLRESGRWYGMIDMLDICRYVIAHFGGGAMGKDKPFWDMVQEEGEFAKKKVADLMMFPNVARNPFHPILSHYSAFSVVEALAREPSVHRIPIIDNPSDRKLLNLVTESQVAREIHRLLPTIGEKAHKPIVHCGHFFKAVLAVTEDTVALDAFNLMVLKNVQGLAVVDEDTGKLRGNISLRDLKVIGNDASFFWRLHQTVKNFLLKVRHEFQAKHNRPRRPVYVVPSASLKDVLDAFTKHDVHRVYIVDNHHDKRPIGIVAIKDILLEILVK